MTHQKVCDEYVKIRTATNHMELISIITVNYQHVSNCSKRRRMELGHCSSMMSTKSKNVKFISFYATFGSRSLGHILYWSQGNYSKKEKKKLNAQCTSFILSTSSIILTSCGEHYLVFLYSL